MSDVAQVLISSSIAIIVALIPIVFKRNKPQDLSSEDIEEINNPDGSSIRRHKRKFK